MRTINDVFDGLGRRHLAAPPLLSSSLLLGIFLCIGAGQIRLQHAGERVQASGARAHAVDSLQSSLARAVGAQRGLLLTNDSNYLAPYDKAVAEVEPALAGLRAAYTDSDTTRVEMSDLQTLIGERLADLAMIRTIEQTHGAATAIDLVRTGAATDAGQEIGRSLDRLRQHEADERTAAEGYWRDSMTLSRWITVAGAICSIVLVGIAARSIHKDVRRRALLTDELRQQQRHLEQQADQRTQELEELSTHLQNVAEREKASLARELHDELGGLLVGARMDISWAEQHLAKNDPDMKQRLNRVQRNLAAGVDLKRRIIEELRPTLLDNVGLFAALRWVLKETCGAAGLKCIESYPDKEPRFKSEASIALFRIAQEAYGNILKHAEAKTVDVSLDLDGETVLLRIADDGNGIPLGRSIAIASHGLAAMRHRVRALGGRLDVRSPSSGGTLLVVQIPAENAVLAYDEAESM